jgi:uncharacterized protein
MSNGRGVIRSPASQGIPSAGVGLGLRSVHYGHILEHKPKVPFFEIISENYMGTAAGSGGRPGRMLDQVRRDYPIVMHGVSMSIGSVDPLDMAYLKKLKALADRVQPLWVSDHFCWTGAHGENLHDLLPLPYTMETVRHVAERVKRVQDILGRRLLLENLSSYVSFRHSEMTEWECLREVAERADCLFLLDINNIHVSAVNHKFDGRDYLNGIPVERVRQMHLAGYSDMGTHILDTHDHPVSDPVWDLFEAAVERFGAVPAMIEWDDNIPPFERLHAEARKAEKIQDKVLARGDLRKTVAA